MKIRDFNDWNSHPQVAFASCSQTMQPNSATSFHIQVQHYIKCHKNEFLYNRFYLFFQPNSAKDEIMVKTEGTYKIEFTALMKSTDAKLMRAEVFKVPQICLTCHLSYLNCHL